MAALTLYRIKTHQSDVTFCFQILYVKLVIFQKPKKKEKWPRSLSLPSPLLIYNFVQATPVKEADLKVICIGDSMVGKSK
jgi:hypothetical protein